MTEPTPDAALPAVLSDDGGPWYGEDGLWTQVPNYPANVSDGTYKLKHPWVTLDGAGDLTPEFGPPTIRTQQLHGTRTGAASFGGYATTPEGMEFWPTVASFPAPGCWVEVASLGGTTVRLVVEVHQ